MILNSPTTTERDHNVVGYLEQVLAVDPTEFGRDMFERTSDLEHVPAEQIVKRDAKDYDAGAHTLRIAQVETVGQDLGERRDELLEALDEVREKEGHALVALMVTDIMGKGSQLYVSGERPRGRARVRRDRRRRRRHRPARRHEPQEAGRAQAARSAVGMTPALFAEQVPATRSAGAPSPTPSWRARCRRSRSPSTSRSCASGSRSRR